ncbi:MAG: aminodeoxychorismate/anthranilate synthase component II [Pseudomonadota bacterium]
MILLIDNYDSFTFNLMHLIAGLDEEVVVKRNDALSAQEAVDSGADAIVLSPGPCTPNEAGICVELVKLAAAKETPVFGVCLGMQAIAAAFGGGIRRADQLMHGKTCEVIHDGGWLFEGAPSPFVSTRYHSLVAAPEDFPGELIVDAHAADDNEIMSLRHRTLPIAGVQFHPESIAAECGPLILRNFLRRARNGNVAA